MSSDLLQCRCWSNYFNLTYIGYPYYQDFFILVRVAVIYYFTIFNNLITITRQTTPFSKKTDSPFAKIIFIFRNVEIFHDSTFEFLFQIKKPSRELNWIIKWESTNKEWVESRIVSWIRKWVRQQPGDNDVGAQIFG